MGRIVASVRIENLTDERLAPLQGVDASISEEDVTPVEGFNRIKNIQIHVTGGIL